MLPVGDTSEQQTQPADPDAQHAELIVQLLTAPKADRDFLERSTVSTATRATKEATRHELREGEP